MMCHAYHHYYTLATVKLAIANAFMQWQEDLFIFNFQGLLGLLHFNVLGVAFYFVWFIFCVLHQFEIPLVHIALAFTLQATFRSMSTVIIFMPTLSPKLARLLCLCTCVHFLCYILVLCPLLLKVGFVLNFISFWGSLRFISRAFDCFIGTFQPFKIRSGRLFAYPLI